MMRGVITVALAAALAGCSSDSFKTLQQNLFVTSPGAAALKAGLKQYDEGAYAESAKSLHNAIGRGLNDPELANAYKHLAFMHCAGNRVVPCREEFRKALTVDPELELAPAEAGHPIWGPVFKSVKAGR
ncbi:MAG TPA: TssQ family T6SS-associated lipoprotein [Burkholderiales bacterium]